MRANPLKSTSRAAEAAVLSVLMIASYDGHCRRATKGEHCSPERSHGRIERTSVGERVAVKTFSGKITIDWIHLTLGEWLNVIRWAVDGRRTREREGGWRKRQQKDNRSNNRKGNDRWLKTTAMNNTLITLENTIRRHKLNSGKPNHMQ